MTTLRLALPKGRQYTAVLRLLSEAGIQVSGAPRSYRPAVSLPHCDAKVLKPPDLLRMLHEGSRDLGFAGPDQVDELDLADGLVELLDTGLDPVSIVAAAPPRLLQDGALPRRPLRVASEYASAIG